MDSSGKTILCISSDEEVGWAEGGLPSATDVDAVARDDGNWLTKLLEKFDGKVNNSLNNNVVDDSLNNVVDDSLNNNVVDDSLNNVADNSHELVVAEEKFPTKKIKVEKPSAKWESSAVDDNDDDDCIVLDGDPDKPVEVNNGGEHDDSDELLLVSEKGQVACRDYPHPRHLCVKFAFSSSPHETHCDQCHCYVCDSLAPCLHWGTGISSIDHCHATDKDEFWKSQRRSSKNGGIIAQSVVPNATYNSICVGPTDISQSAYLLNDVLSQENFMQGASAIISTTNNFINTHRPRQPVSMTTNAAILKMQLSNARSRYHPYLVSQQLRSVDNANPRPEMPNNLHYNNFPGNSHPPGPRYPVMPSLYVGTGLSTRPNMGSGLMTPYASAHRQVPPQAHVGPWSQWSSENHVPSFSGNSLLAPQQKASQPHSSSGFPYMALESNTSEVFQNPILYQHLIPSSCNTVNPLPAQTAAQVSQFSVPYPNLHDISNLLERHISNQDQVHDQLLSQPKECLETETGRGWNSHTNETNENVTESSQQMFHQAAKPAAVNGDLQMLAEAIGLDFDDWDTTFGMDFSDIPSSHQPNNNTVP